MRLAHHLLRHPSGVYHFRFVVPSDLRTAFGVKIFKRSLHTTNPATARVWAYVLSAKYADLIRSLRGLDVSSKKPTVEDVQAALKKSGRYEIEVGPNGFRLKTDGTNKDHHDALESIGKVSEEPWFKAMMAKATADEITQNKGAPTISLVEAVAKWEEFLKPTTRVVKTMTAKTKALKDLLAWEKTNAMKVTDLTRTLCAEFAVYLMNDQKNKKNTASNKMLWLAHFFEWAQSSGYYPSGDNPARGHLEITEADKTNSAQKFGWRPFTNEELKALFKVENFERIREQHTRWAIVIGFYTGLRVNEVGQLFLDNFVIEDGIKCLHIEPARLKIKTNSSERFVPIHQKLLQLGLWDKVKNLKESGETYLFPSLGRDVKNGPGNAITSATSRLIGYANIKKVGQTKTGFHSFRDTVEVEMKRHNVPLEAREEFVGHDDNRRNAHARSYSEKYKPAALAKLTLPGLKFEGVNIDAIKHLLET